MRRKLVLPIENQSAGPCEISVEICTLSGYDTRVKWKIEKCNIQDTFSLNPSYDLNYIVQIQVMSVIR